MAKFELTPDDLVPAAQLLCKHMRQRGFKATIEPASDPYPAVPTIHAKRDGTTVIFVVASQIPSQAIHDWVNYARSCSADMRIAVGVSASEGIEAKRQTEMRDLGVGVYWIQEGRVDELVSPHDLSLNLSLPSRGSLPVPLRGALADVYDKYERGDWVDCFEAAALALETEARAYLKEGLKRGRITLIRGKRSRAWSPSAHDIGKMTMGDLKTNFGYIQNQNAADAQAARALAKINNDRILVVHHRKKKSTKTRLRKNVGPHVWLVIATLAKMKGIDLKM